MPEVSVIMPVYNKAEYLAHGLQSILDQTFPDFELLVINDGSTDDSLAILQNFAQKDPRIIIFDIPNGGVSKARNLGLDNASGKYITFIDADDYVAPDYLKNMYDLLCHHDVDIVISGVTKYWTDREDTHKMVPPLTGLTHMRDLLPSFSEFQKRTSIYGICVAKMFPQSLTRNIRFNETIKLAEDFDYYLRIYELVDLVYCDDQQYYFYLLEANNSSVKIADADIDYVSQFNISLAYRKFLISKQSYTDSNKRIVDEQISNYLFLSLHYCSEGNFRERFTTLKDSCQANHVYPSGTTAWRKIILSVFHANAYWLTYLLTQTYHTARRIVRGIK